MSRAASKGRSAGGVILASAMFIASAFASPATAQDPDGLLPEHDWTDDQIDYMLDLIDRTETTLPANFPASYTDGDTSELEDLGYFNFGVTSPGGWDHWLNPDFIQDNTDLVNPETPESLVYRNVGGGEWVLEAAMFMGGPDDDVDDLPDDVAWLPGWHGHPELCSWDDSGGFAGVTDPDDPSCPPGSSPSPTPVMMHVWITDNDCDHRFGGVGVGGLHCDVVHDHGDDGHDDDHDDGDHSGDDHDDDDGHDDDDHDDGDGSSAPAAVPVSGAPSFTG